MLNLFSGYWDALSHLSSQLKQIPVDKRRIRRQYNSGSEIRYIMGKQQLTKDAFINENIRGPLGHFHGLIMDIDYFNHLYINPQDGKVTAYNVANIMSRDTYPNVGALLKDQVPALYNGYKKMLQKGQIPLLSGENERLLTTQDLDIAMSDEEMSEEDVKEKSKIIHSEGTYIYELSRKFLELQSIYNCNLVTVWNDNILNSIHQISSSNK